MRKADRFVCLLLIFTFILGAGVFDGGFAGGVSAAESFETVPGSTLAVDTHAGTLRSLVPGTTVRTVKGNFKTAVTVCKPDGSPADEAEAIGTDYKVKSGSSVLTVVIAGDVSCDGCLSLPDYIAGKKAGQGKCTLSAAALCAADLSDDGIFNVSDIVLLQAAMSAPDRLYSALLCRPYELTAAVPMYSSAADAAAKANSAGVAEAGSYCVHRSYPAGLNGMYCLTGGASGESFWIDPRDNVPAQAAVGTPYVLTQDMPKYTTATDAAAQTNSTGVAEAGTYYIYDKYPAGLNGMYNISTDITGKSAGFWINPADSPLGAGGELVLVRNVNKYENSADACRQTNVTGVADAGTYYIYDKYPTGLNGMYNISTDITGKSAGFWINPAENTSGKLNYRTLKGLWLSQYDLSNVYVTNGKQTKAEIFRAKMAQIFAAVKDSGYNTVMVQVRPNGDSFYASAYYPWSKYVVGAYGKPPIYDPLPIVIEEAHKLALSVHAWANPMRLMSASDIKKVGDGYIIKQWYNDSEKNGTYIVRVNDYYYLNPSYADVRDLIVNGVKEICLQYNVDGVHFDDYFYPEGVTDAFDQAAFDTSGQASRAHWRRLLVSDFVRRSYGVAKSVNGGIKFGIAPQGTISVNQDALYADVRTWCADEGYVDYIAPQLYWGFEGASKFDAKLLSWENLVKGGNVRLVPALTLQYAYSGSPQEWLEHKDVIMREMQRSAYSTNFGGVMVFSLQNFYNPASGSYTAQLEEERANFEPVLKAMYSAS